MTNALLGSSLFPAGPNSWPIQHPGDSTECVFMERAIDELARAKYGSNWTGKEPLTRLPESLPDAFDPMHHNALWNPKATNESDEPVQWFDPPPRAVLERAYDLLSLHRPDLEKPSRFAGFFGGLTSRPLRFSIKEWKIAQGLAKKERDNCLEALGSWFDLQEETVSLCERGVLESVLRSVEGGNYSSVLPKSHWLTEKYSVRFVTFLMHPVSPFSSNLPHEMQWIFFTRVSLRRAIALLRNQNGVSPSASGELYASEFMQHMTRVVSKLGITAAKQPKKAVVETTVRDLWTGSTPLSQTDVRSMASLIRSQESRAGRNRSERNA